MTTASARLPAYSAVDRLRSWDALLAMVAGFMVFSVARLHLLFPVVAPARPILLMAAAAIVLFLLDRYHVRRLDAVPRAPVLILAGLAGWMTLGIPFALRQGATFFFVVDSFLPTIVMFVLIAAAVRTIRDVERLAWLYFAGAAAYAAVVLFRFELGAEGWRLGNLITYDANDFSLLAVTAIPLGIESLVRRNRSALLRVVDAVGLGVLLVAFVWAGSRGGFLALLAAAAVFLIRFRRIQVGSRIALAAVAACVIGVTAGARYWEQMRTIAAPEEDYNFTEPTGRIEVWKRGIGYTLERPLLGLGADNFEAAEGTISPRARLQEYGIGVRWSAPHNSFLQVAAETGIPGLLLFLGFIGCVVSGLRRAEARGRAVGRGELPRGPGGAADDALPQALMVALVGFLVGSFFLSLAYSDMLYAIAGMAVGLDKLVPRSALAT